MQTRVSLFHCADNCAFILCFCCAVSCATNRKGIHSLRDRVYKHTHTQPKTVVIMMQSSRFYLQPSLIIIIISLFSDQVD